MIKRYVRLHKTTLVDNRNAPQIDRDRIMYTSAFRRLAKVTQVVSADELYVFHNRLTHSIQVAQVARRCAEMLRSNDSALEPHIDPDVCEAAALAHDLGHPPFGHLAEKALDELARSKGLKDGFEGNAQSFRIVTKLSAHDINCDGLDLTRATLNAMLKYPWLHGKNPKMRGKWGAYDSEREEFIWARKLSAADSLEKSPEARIMDWADDVTYSVHDVEDFYRVGLIPLERLSVSALERNNFYKDVFHRAKGKLPASEDELIQSFEQLASIWGNMGPYTGTYLQRQTLKMMASRLIGEFVQSIHADARRGSCKVRVDRAKELEVFMLKQLTWHYVILNPALATQQWGQRLVIEGLFSTYLQAIGSKDFRIFPIIYMDELTTLSERGAEKSEFIRTMVDMIASMTESQAIHIHHRLNGTTLGSALMNPVG
jgi:dGTPase